MVKAEVVGDLLRNFASLVLIYDHLDLCVLDRVIKLVSNIGLT